VYLTFYGLKEKPFNATPDPKFLYLTPGHREALAQLVYGVEESKGFGVLTGEVGTGKTTLLQALLQRLDGKTAVAFVFDSALPFDGILEYMLGDWGVAQRASTAAQRLFALNTFLIERRRLGQKALLILDEAQHLDPPTLERVRLLSNFETPREKLLQILLVGQPELEAKLRLPELRQLRQRIGLHCRIPPLRPEEIHDYIRTRLRIAGAPDRELFTERAVTRIRDYAGGIPRVVNIVCDHSLLFGYADQKRKIDRDIVEQAIAYLQGKPPRRRAGEVAWRRRLIPLRWVLWAVPAALLAVVLAAALGRDALGAVSELVTTYLLDLARAVRDLVV
jgi:general secretion pathway protein A